MYEKKLHLTHVACADRYPLRWYIRFRADDAPTFDYLCDNLRLQEQECWWESREQWNDGEIGAWCVSDFILRLYSSCFDNFVEMMFDQYDDDAPIWIMGNVRRWTYQQPHIPANVVQALRLLGLVAPVTAEEVKQAYRRSAMQNHPDRYMMEAQSVREAYSEKFKSINRAKETIDRWFACQEVA